MRKLRLLDNLIGSWLFYNKNTEFGPPLPPDPETNPEITTGWLTKLQGTTVIGPSGHSLSDVIFKTAGLFMIGRNALNEPQDVGTAILLSNTGPFATLQYRATTDLRTIEYPLPWWFGDPADMALLDAYVTTEAGPYARFDRPAERDQLLGTMFWGLHHYTHALTYGKQGISTALYWHTFNAWPDGYTPWGADGDFLTVVQGYELTVHYLVGYWEWKLRQLFPELPETFRIPIIPVHRLWIKIAEDIATGSVPGITNLNQLYGDDVHPNALGSYGPASMAYAMLYKTDLRLLERFNAGGLYDPIAEEDRGKWIQLESAPEGFTDYILEQVMDILLEYEPAGLGGTDRGSDTWFDPATENDPLDDDGGGGTDPEPGELPAYVINLSPAGYQGPAYTGTLPTLTDGEYITSGETFLAAHEQTGFYAAVRMRVVTSAGTQFSPFAVHANSTWWQVFFVGGLLNLWFNPPQAFTMLLTNGAPTNDIGSGNQDYSEYRNVEFWAFGNELGVRFDGGPTLTTTTDNPIPQTSYMSMFVNDNGASVDVRFKGVFVMDNMPSVEEATTIRNYLTSL